MAETPVAAAVICPVLAPATQALAALYLEAYGVVWVRRCLEGMEPAELVSRVREARETVIQENPARELLAEALAE